MLGGCRQPGQLCLGRVGELVEGVDHGGVGIQGRIVFGSVQRNGDLGDKVDIWWELHRRHDVS